EARALDEVGAVEGGSGRRDRRARRAVEVVAREVGLGVGRPADGGAAVARRGGQAGRLGGRRGVLREAVAGDPGRATGERPVDGPGAVGGGRPGAFVEAPPAEEAGGRAADLVVAAGPDLGARPGDAPDADLVDRAGEEAGGGAGRGQ